jgi:queuine tRNA-ribosyltransferase
MTFSFNITHKDPNSYARTGVLTTPHGAIETPNFIFCGTKASVKGLSPLQLRECGTDIILSNTYHLMLSPGPDLVADMGGLHKFMNWNGPMFTDSGGFQIFSLGYGSVADEIKGRGKQGRPKTILKITEEGASFKSYLDGRTFFLTPEESINIQRKLGADLIVQLDECTPFHVDKDYTAKSMRMSMRWGDRSLAEWKRHDDGKQRMYGIVQGGVYPDLRKESCEYTRDRDFFATAIGGSLGSHKEQMYEVVACARRISIRSARCICWASAASLIFSPTCVQAWTLLIVFRRPVSPAMAGRWSRARRRSV